MRLKIVPLSGMGGPYALKDEDGPPGYTAQWIKDKKLAYMFAAAPDLLEACKAALAWHEGWDHQNCIGFGDDERDEVIRKLEAAIAKAEGRGKK